MTISLDNRGKAFIMSRGQVHISHYHYLSHPNTQCNMEDLTYKFKKIFTFQKLEPVTFAAINDLHS